MPDHPPRVAERLAPFGTSIFAQMTRLATQHNAVNLAQGFPDFDGPGVARGGVDRALAAGHSQYSRMIGVSSLNEAIASSWASRGLGRVDPEREITVTSGCSEAIVAALMGLFNPGDEIVIFEPYFDFYTACAAMAGLTPRYVTLRPPTREGDHFTFDEGELRAAFTPRTRGIFVNTPHNPTGKVYSREELLLIASLCEKHGVVAITDEVYEHLIYDAKQPHVQMRSLPGMEDRTVTLSSLGKTFSLTGWKIGWAVAPEHLSAGIRAAHQFLTFCAATPLQHAAAEILRDAGGYTSGIAAMMAENRDRLGAALTRLGLKVHRSDSTYFLMADHSPLGYGDDHTFCRHLTERVGVAAIPPSVFYSDPSRGRTMARFAFCKRRETIDEAIARLARLTPAR